MSIPKDDLEEIEKAIDSAWKHYKLQEWVRGESTRRDVLLALRAVAVAAYESGKARAEEDCAWEKGQREEAAADWRGIFFEDD